MSAKHRKLGRTMRVDERVPGWMLSRHTEHHAVLEAMSKMDHVERVFIAGDRLLVSFKPGTSKSKREAIAQHIADLATFVLMTNTKGG